MIKDMKNLFESLHPEITLNFGKDEKGRFLHYCDCPYCYAENTLVIPVDDTYFICNACHKYRTNNMLLDDYFGKFSEERVMWVLQKQAPYNYFDYVNYSKICHPVNFKLNNQDSKILYNLPEDRESVKPCPVCGRSLFMYVVTKANVKPYCLFCGQHQPVPRKTKNINKPLSQKRNAKKSTEWRYAVGSRYNFACALCGSTEGCEAHHIVPYSKDESQQYNINNGIYLCARHHKLAHEPLKVYKPKNGIKDEDTMS